MAEPGLATQSMSLDRRSKLLNDYKTSDSWNDLMFEGEQRSRPWKKVALAVGLLLLGSVLLSVGLGLYMTQGHEAPWLSLIIIGSICFLPGFYHTRIAYLAWKGVKGFSLDHIPDW